MKNIEEQTMLFKIELDTTDAKSKLAELEKRAVRLKEILNELGIKIVDNEEKVLKIHDI